MRALWKGAEGRFSSASFLLRGGGLYLGLSGPVNGLSSGTTSFFKTLQDCPLIPALGFFLGLHHPDDEEGFMTELDPLLPAFSFEAARLSLLSIETILPNLQALVWKEKALSYRRNFRHRTGDRGSAAG